MKRLAVSKSHGSSEYLAACNSRSSPTNQLKPFTFSRTVDARTDIFTRDRACNRRMLSDTRDISYLQDKRRKDWVVTLPTLPTDLEQMRKLQLSTDALGLLHSSNPTGKLNTLSCKKMHSVDYAIQSLLSHATVYTEGSTNDRVPLGLPVGRQDAAALKEWYVKVKEKQNVPLQKDSDVVLNLLGKELTRQVSVQCIERGNLLREFIEDLQAFYKNKLKNFKVATAVSQEALKQQSEETKKALEGQLTNIKVKFRLADQDKAKYKAKKDSYKAKFSNLASQQESVEEQCQVLKHKLMKASMNFQGAITPSAIKVSSSHTATSCEITPMVSLRPDISRCMTQPGLVVSCQTDRLYTQDSSTQTSAVTQTPANIATKRSNKFFTLTPSFSKSARSIQSSVRVPVELIVTQESQCAIRGTKVVSQRKSVRSRAVNTGSANWSEDSNTNIPQESGFEVLDKDLLEIQLINDALSLALYQLQQKKLLVRQSISTDEATARTISQLQSTLGLVTSHTKIDESTQTMSTVKRTVKFDPPRANRRTVVRFHPKDTEPGNSEHSDSPDKSDDLPDSARKRMHRHHATQRIGDGPRERTRGITIFKEFQFNTKDSVGKRKTNSGAKKYYQLLKKSRNALKKKANMSRKVVSKTIAAIYHACTAKLKLSEEEFIDLIYEEFVQKYGLTNVCERKFVEFVATVHTTTDAPRVQTFARLLRASRTHSLQLAVSVWKFMHQSKTGVTPPVEEAAEGLWLPWTRASECLRDKLESVLPRAEYSALFARVEQSAFADPKKQNALGLVDMDVFMHLILETYSSLEANIAEGSSVVFSLLGPQIRKSDLEVFVRRLCPVKLSILEDFAEDELLSCEQFVSKCLDWQCFSMTELRQVCPDTLEPETVISMLTEVIEQLPRDKPLLSKLETLKSAAQGLEPFSLSLAWKVCSAELCRVETAT